MLMNLRLDFVEIDIGAGGLLLGVLKVDLKMYYLMNCDACSLDLPNGP